MMATLAFNELIGLTVKKKKENKIKYNMTNHTRIFSNQQKQKCENKMGQN